MGPNLGLDLVHSREEVAEIANLGLVFLWLSYFDVFIDC